MGQQKHGKSKTRLYRIWHAMFQRCNNPKHTAFDRYGGRGIKVCKSWDAFEVFASWSDKHGYSDDLSIDRKDNDKGYSPSNCRWATLSEQRNNRRPVPALPKPPKTVSRRNTSGHTNIVFNKSRQTFSVQVYRSKKSTYLGNFVLIEDAIEARDAFIRRRLNETFHRNQA